MPTKHFGRNMSQDRDSIILHNLLIKIITGPLLTFFKENLLRKRDQLIIISINENKKSSEPQEKRNVDMGQCWDIRKTP